MSFLDALKKVGKFVARIVTFAKNDGLTDALVQMILNDYVPQAAVLYAGDTEARREWVVAEVLRRTMKDGKPTVSESIIRLALEIAVRAYKTSATSPTP